MFFNERIQELLNGMTGRDEKKIFHPKYRDTAKPKYRLVTDKELEEVSRTNSDKSSVFNLLTIEIASTGCGRKNY